MGVVTVDVVATVSIGLTAVESADRAAGDGDAVDGGIVRWWREGRVGSAGVRVWGGGTVGAIATKEVVNERKEMSCWDVERERRERG